MNISNNKFTKSTIKLSKNGFTGDNITFGIPGMDAKLVGQQFLLDGLGQMEHFKNKTQTRPKH